MEWHIRITSNQARWRERGFTLAEALLATALLAITVAAIASPFAAAYKQTTQGSELTQANSLARELMEEVATRPFVDPTDGSTTLGPESGENSKSKYDNIDDFNGYKDNTSNMTGENGTAIAWNGHGVYKRSVAVEYRATPSGSATSSGNFAVVTVTVETPSGKQATLQRLFCRYPRGN